MIHLSKKIERFRIKNWFTEIILKHYKYIQLNKFINNIDIQKTFNLAWLHIQKFNAVKKDESSFC